MNIFDYMKIHEKSNTDSKIDQDTGLPNNILKEELLKGAKSPIVKMSIHDILEDVKQKGRNHIKGEIES